MDTTSETSPESLRTGLKMREIKFLLYYLGRVGNCAGNITASAACAGYKGHKPTLCRTGKRVLKKANIALEPLLDAQGADLLECIKAMSKGLRAKDRKAFINPNDGEIVLSSPFENTEAHRVRLKSAELLLALHGVTTKRASYQINVDTVRQSRPKRERSELRRS